MRNPDAPPGKDEKYARRERERRFLLAAMPPGKPVRRVLIEDHYMDGTRLRLRRMTELGPADEPGDVTYKLTQKVPSPNGTPGLITTLYLSAREYQAVAVVPGRALRKVRTSIPPFGVDEFQGRLAGLILAEVEFETDDEAAALQPPDDAVAEVTADERFTGGRLVQGSRDDLRDLIDEFGVASSIVPGQFPAHLGARLEGSIGGQYPRVMAGPGLVIREAAQGDLGSVGALDALVQKTRDRSNRLARSQAEARLIVAERDGDMVGYAVQSAFFEYDFLELLIVHPSHRRQGIGMALLQAIEGRCRTGKLFTSTNRSNAAMQRLCETFGFKGTGVVDNLDEGDPELFYFKKT